LICLVRNLKTILAYYYSRYLNFIENLSNDIFANNTLKYCITPDNV